MSCATRVETLPAMRAPLVPISHISLAAAALCGGRVVDKHPAEGVVGGIRMAAVAFPIVTAGGAAVAHHVEGAVIVSAAHA